MNVTIIDYGAGNTQSVKFALQRLGIEPILTNKAEKIQQADKVIFPGVGHAKQAMNQLRKSNLVDVISDLKQPVLGICLGMQLMCNSTEEGDQDCLGIFDTRVKRFVGKEKIPHMGWNNLEFDDKTPLLKGINEIEEEPNVYFVHSYYAPVTEETIATASYMIDFSACLQANNFYGCQFHPEKSGQVGEQILKNFFEI